MGVITAFLTNSFFYFCHDFALNPVKLVLMKFHISQFTFHTHSVLISGNATLTDVRKSRSACSEDLSPLAYSFI